MSVMNAKRRTLCLISGISEGSQGEVSPGLRFAETVRERHHKADSVEKVGHGFSGKNIRA